MSNEQTTGSDGKATFENTAYGDYTLTITADGYTTKTENIAFRSNHKNFTIALVEETPTTNYYTVNVYAEETGGEPVGNVVGEFTGTIENNRKEMSVVSSGTSVWISENAIDDGTTRTGVYQTSSSETIQGYITFRPLNPTDKGTLTINCSDDTSTGLYDVTLRLYEDESASEPIGVGLTGSESTEATIGEPNDSSTPKEFSYGAYYLRAECTSDGIDYEYNGEAYIFNENMRDSIRLTEKV